MTDLMRALYIFAEERELEKYFLGKEYSNYQWAIKQKMEEIRMEYPQVRKKLNDLLSELNASYSCEYEAAFQVGFLLRGELTRLQRSYEGLFE